MSPMSPSRPEAGTKAAHRDAYLTLVRLFLQITRSRSRFLVLGGLGLLTVATALTTPQGSDSPGELTASFVAATTTFLVPIVAIVVGTALFGDLFDDGSVVYLTSRRAPRLVLALAGWTTALIISLPFATVPVLLGAARLADSPDQVLWSLLPTLLGAAGYTAVFLLIGIRSKRPMVTSLLVYVLWDVALGAIGTASARLTLSGYLRSATARIYDIPLEGAPFLLAPSILVPMAITAGALALSGRALDRAEVP